MKKASFAVLGVVSLVLLFAMAAPLYAQDEEKPAHQEEKASQPKEDKTAQPTKEDKAATAHQEEKDAQPAHSGDKGAQENKEEKAAQEEDKHPAQKQETGKQDNKQVHETTTTTTQRTETQTQHTRGRIPDDRFRANFGREHVFVINRPVIVEGAPRFQYGGYWFVIANPWPAGWAYTDQVYVDYVSGGYYLLSPVHPGVQVSINVVL